MPVHFSIVGKAIFWLCVSDFDSGRGLQNCKRSFLFESTMRFKQLVSNSDGFVHLFCFFWQINLGTKNFFLLMFTARDFFLPAPTFQRFGTSVEPDQILNERGFL